MSCHRRKLAHASLLSVLILGAASGCATPGSRPDDMSASAHAASADEAAKRATGHRESYDPEAREVRTRLRSYGAYGYDLYGLSYGYGGYSDLYWEVEVYNPTRRHLARAKREEKHATDHRAAAEVLERFEAGQCSAFPPETRAASPLLGQVEDVADVYGGVRLRFAPDVDMNAAVAHVRCHLAFARTRARIGMDECPLYVGGVDVERLPRSRSIELSVADPEALEELKRRAHTMLGEGPPEAGIGSP